MAFSTIYAVRKGYITKLFDFQDKTLTDMYRNFETSVAIEVL
jgi:hypothetical protein